MGNIFVDACDEFKSDDAKSVFVSYIEEKKIDGTEFMKMKRKEFTKSVMKFDNKKTPKLMGICTKVYRQIMFSQQTEVPSPDNEAKQSEESKQSAEMVDWKNINDILDKHGLGMSEEDIKR